MRAAHRPAPTPTDNPRDLCKARVGEAAGDENHHTINSGRDEFTGRYEVAPSRFRSRTVVGHLIENAIMSAATRYKNKAAPTKPRCPISSACT
jgi:hypothetical protein